MVYGFDVKAQHKRLVTINNKLTVSLSAACYKQDDLNGLIGRRSLSCYDTNSSFKAMWWEQILAGRVTIYYIKGIVTVILNG